MKLIMMWVGVYQMSDKYLVSDNKGNMLLELVHLSRQPGSTSSRQLCYHTLRICLVLGGSGEWTVGSKVYDIIKGDIFIFNNTETRAISAIYPPDNMNILYLQFEPRFIWSGYGEASSAGYLKIFLSRDPYFENRLDRESSERSQIAGLILDIRSEFEQRQPEFKAMVRAKFLQLLISLSRYYNNNDQLFRSATQVSINAPAMLRLLEYIDTHLSEDLRLNDLADMININPAYLSSVFGKYNGLSLSQYIMRKRVYNAIQLLQHSEHTVLDVAHQCGFNTLSGFYKAFKKITNRVPSDYR